MGDGVVNLNSGSIFHSTTCENRVMIKSAPA